MPTLVIKDDVLLTSAFYVLVCSMPQVPSRIGLSWSDNEYSIFYSLS